MEVNQWNLLPTKIFKKKHESLILSVEKLRKKNPKNYQAHPKTKLLACIQNAIKKDVPEDPNHKKFSLGNTLGPKFTHWRRVKKKMPPRYRMFFQFRSKYVIKKGTNPGKWIIFAWFNDEDTLRKDGSRNDAYVVFKSLLLRNAIPDNWDKLFLEAESAKNNKKTSTFWN